MNISRTVLGERVTRGSALRLVCCAAIFDTARERLLLTRRSDNGLWCLPGGGMDAGESAAEACEREVLEETGLTVKVDKLIGVYSNPHRVIEHLGGRRTQGVALNFEAKVVSGKLTITEETTGVGYYSPEEMQSMAVWDHHRERINDALAGVSTAFIR